MMHRYLEMTRSMLLAKFKYEDLKLRLEGPRAGVIVRLVREATGLTQAQLAERIGVHHTYLSKVCNDKAKPGLPLFEKLYDAWEQTQSLEALPRVERLSNPMAVESPGGAA
jgi:transcriptional regulator with XRE-family HTH domain